MVIDVVGNVIDFCTLTLYLATPKTVHNRFNYFLLILSFPMYKIIYIESFILSFQFL